MAVVDALVRLKADTAQFSKAMADASKATGNVGKSADNTAGILSKKLKVGFSVATAAAGAFAIKLGRDSVQAAQTAAAAQNRLRKLLLNTNGATEEQIQVLFQQGQALEKLTGITSENVTVVQSQLATFDLHGSTIGKLTPAILDYVVAEKGAAAGADEFRMMTTGLAQAINGNFGALTKQGFVIDANTKKMIASGTENERAQAIVDVLGFTYRDFAKTALTPAQRAQADFTRTVGDAQKALGFALIPIIGEAAGALSKTFGPTITEIQKKLQDGDAVKSFVSYIKDLGKNILDFAKAIITVFEPIFTGLIVPAIKLAIGAVIGFIKVIGAIGRFIQNNMAAFQLLVGAVVAVAAAMAAYIIQVKVVNAVHKAFILIAAAKGKALKMLTKGFKMLNLVMKLNPIGLIISAVTLLIVGFAMLWKKSDTFRNMMIDVGKAGLKAIGFIIRIVGVMAEAIVNYAIGPIKLLLYALSFINPQAKKAYNSLDGMTKGVGAFFDNAAKNVEGFAKNLDGLNKKEVTGPKVKVAETPLDLSKLGKSDKVTISDKQAKAIAAAAKKADAAAKKIAEMKRNLEEAVAKYNDYLKTDFAESFMNGADSARDSVASALDNLGAVFEAKGKMLSGAALESLRSAFDKIKKDVTAMGEQLALVAAEIEVVSDKIKIATTELEDALKERAASMKKFGELLSTPFGEPSQIDKSMRESEATVDSIIGMYEQLVETVNQRFSGMEQGAKSLIVDYLTDQTAAIIKLVKIRSNAVDALKETEKDLEEVLQTQKKFQEQLTEGVKDFAKALITLSDADTKAVLTVTKTASGLVISQVKKASTGVDSIVGQLTTRLKQVVTFSKNIETLLAAGLSKEYIQQLLEAGPSAASETAALLTTASAEQIAQINSLYTNINTQAASFGTQMSKTFYDNSVAMHESLVKGAKDEIESVNAQITVLVTGIKTIMGVLGNTGLTSAQLLMDGLVAGFGEVNKALVGTAALGVNESVTKALESLRTLGTSLITDLVAGALKKLNDDKLVLVAKAKEIADAIAEAMAGAAAGIGVIVDGASGDIAELNKQIAAARLAADKITTGGGGKDDKGGKKDEKTDKKYLVPGTGTYLGSQFIPPQYTSTPPKSDPNKYISSSTFATAPIKPPTLSKVVGATATVKMPTVIKPPTITGPKPSYMSNAGTPVNKQGVPQTSKPPVTVNITTQKVVPTVTSNTISSAIARAQNSRRG